MYSPSVERPRFVPLAIVGAGTLALGVGVAAGGDAALAGAIAFLISCALALGEATRSIVTWPNAILLFIGVVWFVPIKLYSLPVNLPFEFELYRVLILLMVVGFVTSSIVTGRQVDTVGAGMPLFLLAIAALTSQIVNTQGTNVAGGESQALKSLSFFLSFIVVFVLVASTIDSVRDVDKMLAGIVICGAIVSFAALYEGRTHTNLFDRLDSWFPFSRNEREVLAVRGGRLRVHASAQHPIALGAVLIMVVPFAMYLAQKAVTRVKVGFWVVAAGILMIGALATISRTAVAMGVTMLIVTLWVRPNILPRLLPVLLVLPIVAHVAAPGALGGLSHSFGIGGGRPLIESVQGRAGQPGSGRLDDIEPGLDLWSRSPLVGLGVGTEEVATSGVPLAAPTRAGASTAAIIFDNQYLRTLVSLGLVGFIGTVWFVWGSVIRLGRRSKRLAGDDGNLLAACAIACGGYGAGLAFFDAFSFVQVTLIFFIVAALGLRAMVLARGSVPKPL